MTHMNARPPSEETSRLATNSAIAAALVFFGTLLVAALEFYLYFTLDIWQYGVCGVVTAVLAIESAIAYLLSRRGHSTLGLGLLFLSGPVIFAVHTAFIAGIALPMAMGILIVLVSGPPVIMPDKYVGRLLLLGLVSGIIILVIDRLTTAVRVTAPPFLPVTILTVVSAVFVLNIILLARQFVHLSLGTKLTLATVLVSLISAGVVAAFSIYSTRQSLVEVSTRSLTSAAAQAAGTVDNYLSANLTTIAREAQLPAFGELLSLPEDLRSTAQQQQAFVLLNNLAEKEAATISTVSGEHSSILGYLLLDESGKVVLSTNQSEVGQDFSRRDYFTAAIRSEKPYVSAIEFTPSNQVYLHFAAGVLPSRARSAVGVLVMRVNGRILQTIVEGSNELAGAGSYPLLIDENHLRLGQGNAPDLLYTTLVPLPSSLVADLQSARRIPVRLPQEQSTDLVDLESGLLATAAGSAFRYTGEDGSQGMMAVARDLQNQNWQLVYTQPEAGLLAVVDDQLMYIQLLALIAAAVAASVAIWMSHLLANPIRRLTAAAGAVIAGATSEAPVVDSGDEVGRLAAAFNTMTRRLQSSITDLEARVAERTAELERRSRYLEASAQVGQATSSILDLKELIGQSVDLIQESFDLYYTGLFLVDEKRQWAVLQAGTGAAGEAMLRRGHRLRVDETSMIGWCIVNARARIALEAETDLVRQETSELPETRSEAALPLRSRGLVLGALSVQSSHPQAFDEQMIATLQLMADQVAVAIENARLFAASQEALEAARRAHRETSRAAWQKMLSKANLGYLASEAGTAPTEIWQPEMDRALSTGEIVIGSADATNGGSPPDDRNPLAVPIKVRGQVVGVIDTFKPGEWTEEEIALLQTLTEQLSVALDSARLYAETQQQAERERTVAEITARMRETLEIDTVLKTAVSEIYRALGLHDVVIKLEKPE